MKLENVAEGLDVFTGVVTEVSITFDGLHTGEAWVTAVPHHYGNAQAVISSGLVMFDDTSYLDLHGTLATTPILFTLSILNKASKRNIVEFWRPVTFISNLEQKNFTSGVESTEKSRASVDNENRCLYVALSPLCQLHLGGGFRMMTLGRVVKVKVWIHFIIGDIQGNNNNVQHSY
jgi:hypothetical protein